MVRALTHRYRRDAADAFLEEMRARIDGLRAHLVDGASVAAVVVTRAEPMVAAESTRYVARLSELGIRVAGVIVNVVTSEPSPDVAPNSATYRLPLVDPPPRYLFSRQRLRGYQRALEEGGIAFDPALVNEANIGARRVRERVTQFLAMPDRPTGFVTSNEVATMGAISAARALPPKEFKRLHFVSRDGTNIFDYFEPAVSSCYYPLLDVGERLAQHLVKAVEGAGVETLQTVERATFIERPHRTIGETI